MREGRSPAGVFDYLRRKRAYSVLTPVAPGLFLSGEPDESGPLIVRGIQNVLAVAQECPDWHLRGVPGLRIAHVGFEDWVPMPRAQTTRVLRTLRELLQRGPTLVHCGIGVSRSPSVIALYWIATGVVRTFAEGVARLQALRPCVAPNDVAREAAQGVAWRLRQEWAPKRLDKRR